MLEILKAILFGIVEGVTEWLPISSTGHMILLEELVKLDVSEAFYKMFLVVIQLGAICAVILLFFRKLNPFSSKKDAKQKKRTWKLWGKVIAAVIPSAVVGLLLDDWMDEHLYNYWVVAAALILYGVAFILVERRNQGRKPKIRNTTELDYRTAIYIGCFQCLSLIPGTSRSGSTILGAILLGVNRSTAAEFSFFLAIPTMLGASALKLVKYIFVDHAVPSGMEIAILIVGCVVSFAVSLFVIRSLMKFVKNHSFSAFGVYRIVLGAVVLLYGLIKLLAA